MIVRLIAILLFLASISSGVWAERETVRLMNIATEVVRDPLQYAIEHR